MQGLLLKLVIGAATLAFAANSLATDEIWSDRDKRILVSLSWSSDQVLPVSPSNRVADSETARGLGAKLFFDTRLSGNDELSCASCHQPGRYFTDGLAKSRGMGQTQRNAPTVVGAAYNSWFYWDGRRDSLWAQALIPIEAADEMGGSRMASVRLVGSDEAYRELYEEIFGEFPDELLQDALPQNAGPLGSAEMREAWSRLNRDEQVMINSVSANIGKAIAAYERTLLPKPTRFDRYVVTLVNEGESAAAKHMTENELEGARLFIDSERTPCLRCHNGPRLTNGGFHNVGSGNFEGDHLDFGRVFGLPAVLRDEFNCLGDYSDAEPPDCPELVFLNRDSHIPLEGAYKVPSLRNLAATAPYFHDGRFDTIEEVVEYYLDLPAVGDGPPHEVPDFKLTQAEADQLVMFLLTLSHQAID